MLVPVLVYQLDYQLVEEMVPEMIIIVRVSCSSTNSIRIRRRRTSIICGWDVGVVVMMKMMMVHNNYSGR